MNIEKLKRTGEFIYGNRWHSAMARALNVHTRTVQRWAYGKSKISADKEEQILELLYSHMMEIKKFLEN